MAEARSRAWQKRGAELGIEVKLGRGEGLTGALKSWMASRFALQVVLSSWPAYGGGNCGPDDVDPVWSTSHVSELALPVRLSVSLTVSVGYYMTSYTAFQSSGRTRPGL